MAGPYQKSKAVKFHKSPRRYLCSTNKAPTNPQASAVSSQSLGRVPGKGPVRSLQEAQDLYDGVTGACVQQGAVRACEHAACHARKQNKGGYPALHNIGLSKHEHCWLVTTGWSCLSVTLHLQYVKVKLRQAPPLL